MSRLNFLPILLTSVLVAPTVNAELKPMGDTEMGMVTGQAGIQIDVSGQITYDRIVYNLPDGTQEIITPGSGGSTDGVVTEGGVSIDGPVANIPGIPGLFSMLMPFQAGQVDTDGDGLSDRAAAVLSFSPKNMGPGSMLSIDPADTTVNFNDQMFVTKLGIVILNAPIGNDGVFNTGGQDYQYTHKTTYQALF